MPRAAPGSLEDRGDGRGALPGQGWGVFWRKHEVLFAAAARSAGESALAPGAVSPPPRSGSQAAGLAGRKQL